MSWIAPAYESHIDIDDLIPSQHAALGGVADSLLGSGNAFSGDHISRRAILKDDATGNARQATP